MSVLHKFFGLLLHTGHKIFVYLTRSEFLSIMVTRQRDVGSLYPVCCSVRSRPYFFPWFSHLFAYFIECVTLGGSTLSSDGPGLKWHSFFNIFGDWVRYVVIGCALFLSLCVGNWKIYIFYWIGQIYGNGKIDIFFWIVQTYGYWKIYIFYGIIHMMVRK